MPELPEVETTLRGIAPHLQGQEILQLTVREPRLRWPVPGAVQSAVGQRIQGLSRRAKYLVMHLDDGGLLWHLGMSGSMRVLKQPRHVEKHDHVDLVTRSGTTLRFNDPRRFGALLWWDQPLDQHPLLSRLGPEPLGHEDLGAHLWRLSRGRRGAVKTFIMNAHVVVGVGNIYASEALFRAGIHPLRAAGRVSRARYDRLATAIQQVLQDALEEGGTSLRDFTGTDGQPGYFAHNLRVYDRRGKSCLKCSGSIRHRVIGQRASYYCATCQH